MDSPEWAPPSLVSLHGKRMAARDSDDKIRRDNPEAFVANVRADRGAEISEENLENMRRRHYRMMILGPLPEEEEIALLEKLISSQNMKFVWEAMAKRLNGNGNGYLRFFNACQLGIAGWRGDQKQTPLQKKQFYQEIIDTVINLYSLMNQAAAFDSYSIVKLISDNDIEWIVEQLEVPISYPFNREEEISYIRFLLSDFFPSFDHVLEDIVKTAEAFRDKPPIVKQPNSINAEAHYFIRSLSGYCRKAFGQPLHSVVAITTSVIFDLPNCDETYVRKMVAA